jgi:hypothetical protein
MDNETGVAFPSTGSGRSTSALGRAVVADALRAVDPLGARAAERETNWRREYGVHFRRLVEAGLLSPEAAVNLALDGLASLYERMVYSTVDGERRWPRRPRIEVKEPLGDGHRHRQRRDRVRAGAALPRERLRGAELRHRLDTWVAAGVIEPSCAEAVKLVADHPQWLSLPGRTWSCWGPGPR